MLRLRPNLGKLSRKVPLDIDARNFVARHIGLDLVVLFQERNDDLSLDRPDPWVLWTDHRAKHPLDSIAPPSAHN